MARPPPPGFGYSQRSPGTARFVASGSGYTPVNEVHPGPQNLVPPQTSPPSGLPGVIAPPYLPKGYQPQPSAPGPEQSEHCPLSANYPPVQPQAKYGALEMPRHGSATSFPTPSPQMVHGASSTETWPPSGAFGLKQSSYYAASSNYPRVQDQPRHGAAATPLPGFIVGFPTPSTEMGHAVSSSESLPLSSGAFAPERSSYSPTPSNFPPVHYQPRHSAIAMPLPMLDAGYPMRPTGLGHAVSSSECLPPPSNDFGPERSGYSPTSSHYPRACDQPRHSAAAMPLPGFVVGFPTPSKEMGHAVSCSECLPPPSNSFGPESSGYSPASCNHPPVHEQPRCHATAMPLPRLATGFPTTTTGFGQALSSSESLLQLPGAFGTERCGYSPASSDCLPVHDQPRHGATEMPQPGSAYVSRSSSDNNAQRLQQGSSDREFSSQPSVSGIKPTHESKILSDGGLSIAAHGAPSTVESSTSNENMQHTSKAKRHPNERTSTQQRSSADEEKDKELLEAIEKFDKLVYDDDSGAGKENWSKKT